MNYSEQIKAFYSNLNYNPVSSTGISIYLALLYISMLANRSDNLSVANSRLMSLSGLNLTLKQFQCGRNELISKKYISYHKGANQNIAPRYSIARLSIIDKVKNGTAEVMAEGIPEVMAEGMAEGIPEVNLKIRLDLFFNYINNSDEDFFEDGKRTINAKDKTIILQNLKRMDILIDNLDVLNLFSEQSLFRTKLFYWIIKEIYFRPYGMYLKDLTYNQICYIYLQAKEKVKKTVNESNKSETERIIAYTIKSIENELEEKNNKCKK